MDAIDHPRIQAILDLIAHEAAKAPDLGQVATYIPELADVNPQRQALLRDLQEMANLITGLLESERLSAHHTALQREALALGPLAVEVVADVLARQPVVAGARPEVSLSVDPELPTLTLDPARMRLLLRNLLDNALRHSAGAPLPPELHLKTSGSRGIVIEVRDHGPGVPQEQLIRLGEPFYRPDSARTRAQGGVGLGLHLCKLVALAHGGTFSVRNAQPGLAVTVTLPGA